ncbi:proline-rich protein 36-like [Nothobranchius furzeri]|uniref:proline-rich protein 36-like n=1 Tax=Nothobranchius furzeri TaxID=105023 RepID=UPI0039047DC9
MGSVSGTIAFAKRDFPRLPGEDFGIYSSKAEARINCHQAPLKQRRDKGRSLGGPPACDFAMFSKRSTDRKNSGVCSGRTGFRQGILVGNKNIGALTEGCRRSGLGAPQHKPHPESSLQPSPAESSSPASLHHPPESSSLHHPPLPPVPLHHPPLPPAPSSHHPPLPPAPSSHHPPLPPAPFIIFLFLQHPFIPTRVIVPSSPSSVPSSSTRVIVPSSPSSVPSSSTRVVVPSSSSFSSSVPSSSTRVVVPTVSRVHVPARVYVPSSSSSRAFVSSASSSRAFIPSASSIFLPSDSRPVIVSNHRQSGPHPSPTPKTPLVSAPAFPLPAAQTPLVPAPGPPSPAPQTVVAPVFPVSSLLGVCVFGPPSPALVGHFLFGPSPPTLWLLVSCLSLSSVSGFVRLVSVLGGGYCPVPFGPQPPPVHPLRSHVSPVVSQLPLVSPGYPSSLFSSQSCFQHCYLIGYILNKGFYFFNRSCFVSSGVLHLGSYSSCSEPDRMNRPYQDPAEPPGSPTSRCMYAYHGDPDTCWDFIQDSAHNLDMTSSEFNKVSFMVLCLRDGPLEWAADYLEMHPVRTVFFWDFTKKLLRAFGRDPPPPVIPATSSSMSPPSAQRLQPALVQTLRTGFISFSPEPVGAISAPLMGQTTTPSPAQHEPHPSSPHPGSAVVPEDAPHPVPAVVPEDAPHPVPAVVLEDAPHPGPAVVPEDAPHPVPAVVPEDIPHPVPAVVPEDAPHPRLVAVPVQAVPVQPVRDAPVQPAKEVPVQPAQETPVQPAQDAPVQPVAVSQSTPAVSQSTPTVSIPAVSVPAGPTPAGSTPAGSTPAGSSSSEYPVSSSPEYSLQPRPESSLQPCPESSLQPSPAESPSPASLHHPPESSSLHHPPESSSLHHPPVIIPSSPPRVIVPSSPPRVIVPSSSPRVIIPSSSSSSSSVP